jgi:hypothetical protein
VPCDCTRVPAIGALRPASIEIDIVPESNGRQLVAVSFGSIECFKDEKGTRPMMMGALNFPMLAPARDVADVLRTVAAELDKYASGRTQPKGWRVPNAGVWSQPQPVP